MAAAKGGSTAERVRQIVEPIARTLGLFLWDVRYVKEGASYFLRLFIDKEGGVGIDDCERFSRAVDAPLDEADPVSESYYLEVCSPGLGRELTRPEHFEAMAGEEVTVRLYRPRDGQKEFVGVLLPCDGGEVRIDAAGEPVSFEKSEVSKVKLNDDLDLF